VQLLANANCIRRCHTCVKDARLWRATLTRVKVARDVTGCQSTRHSHRQIATSWHTWHFPRNIDWL